MSMLKPQVAIVIPVYNRQHLVLETLRSISIQSYTEWECIIVDDYSTDQTVAEIQHYIKKDNRFTLITKKKERKGAPASRNIGWRKAKADYIIFFDSDDLLAPWALEHRVAFMNENRTLDFALFTNLEFYDNGPLVLKTRIKYKTPNPLHSFLSFDTTWCTPAVIWKKACLTSIDGWDEEALSWQDGEIHIRALLQIVNYGWGDKLPDFFIRLDTPSKISNKNSLEKIKNNFYIFNKIYKQLPETEKALFNQHAEIRLYNTIETLNKDEGKRLIEYTTKHLEFNFSVSKLNRYHQLYHATKNMIGLRKIVYEIRNISHIFTKRKTFYIKDDISMNSLKELRTRLKDIPLYERNIRILNSLDAS